MHVEVDVTPLKKRIAELEAQLADMEVQVRACA